MADEKIQFRFDLDAKDALAKLTELKESINKLGESKSVDGLIQGFMKMAPQIAVVVGAALAMKAAFDLTLEGEALEKINRQFDMIAKQAGLSSTALKEGIEKSLGGMADLDDSLKAANQAIIKLGVNAEKIPQVFEIARKVTSVFGGELNSNFETITQAIATGNTRLLTHIGIIINAEKAYSDYAKTLGTTAGALSKTEQQAALMNAVLKQGEEKFSNLKGPSDTLTGQLQQMKIASKEFHDSLALLVSQSGIVKGVFEALTMTMKGIGGALKYQFTDPTKDSDEQVKRLSSSINYLQGQVRFLEKSLTEARAGKKSFLDMFFGETESNITESLEKTRTNLAKLIAERDKITAAKVTPIEEKPAARPVDEEAIKKRLEQQTKFHRDLEQLNASRIKAEQEVETNYFEFHRLITEQRTNIENQYQLKIQELTQKGRENKEITAAQANEMIIQLEAEKNARLKALDDQRETEVLRSFDNQLNAAKSFGQGWLAAAQKASAESLKDFKDFGKQGSMAFNAVNDGAVTFFRGLGTGAQNAGQLMQNFMFGALGSIADGFGQMYLKAGIAAMAAGSPGGAIQVAEGGALIALGAMLKGQGGGGGASVGSTGGGGGYGGGITSPTETTIAPIAQETPKKTVTVNFLGDYLSTEQTQKRLVELIRQETDATDYKYQQIGVR